MDYDVKENAANTGEFRTGSTVYVHENWSGCIIKSILLEPWENGFRIEYQSIVDQDGNDVDTFPGKSAREFEKMWFSAKEAYEAINNRYKVKVKEYADKIQTIEDLVRFPLQYCINGEEYTDRSALEAYKQRAEELLDERIFLNKSKQK